MEIRRGIEADIHKLGRLWRDMVKEIHPTNEPNVNWWRAIVTQHMRFNREYVCMVAVEGGAIIGFADFKFVLEPSFNKIMAVANHMYVRPEYRKKLIGKKLEDACIKEMANRGASEVTFETDYPDKWKRKGFRTAKYIMSMPVAVYSGPGVTA